ncbi:MAG: DUF1249 domain-containing protein [Sphingobacteriales bacterium]|nr:MAG: DUF1249 domain-containing protein [Sphingobacteriales bacterium]
MNQYEQLFKKIDALVPNLAQIEPGEGLKLTADGFMDLHVDVLWHEKDKTTIAMAHYYKQNGDMVPDPEMQIAVYPDRKMAEALTYQDSFGYREVYPEEGMVNPKAKTELNQFLNQWLNNIKMQGHKVEGSQSEGRAL